MLFNIEAIPEMQEAVITLYENLPEIIRKRLMLFSFIFIGSFFFSTLFSYGFFWVYLVQFTQYFSSPYGLHSDSTQGQDFSSTLLQPSQSLVRSEDSTLKKHKGLAIIQHKQIFELFAVLPLSESLLCKCYWYDCHKTNHMFLWGR